MLKELDINFLVDDILDNIIKAEEDEREDEAQSFRAIVSKYEGKLSFFLKRVFRQQEREVLAKLGKAQKDYLDFYMFDLNIWNKTLQEVGYKYMKAAQDDNGERVFNDLPLIGKMYKDIMAGTSFNMDYPEALLHLEQQAILFSTSVDATTELAVRGAISQGFIEGLTISEISKNVGKVFDHATKVRAEMIARTEMARAANYGAVSAYQQSKVVEGKEWLTSEDEKVCPYCNAMDRKVSALNDAFLIKGGVLEAGDLTMINDYLDVAAPPLHVRCRCTVLPVLSEFVVKPVRKDPVQAMFHNEKDGEYYLKKKKEYDIWMKEQGITSRRNFKRKVMAEKTYKEFSEIADSLESWLVDTDTAEGMAIKYQMARLEGNTKNVVWPSKLAKKEALEDLKYYAPKQSFIKARAFNQSYMEAINLQEKTLYRGTDGPIGELFAKDIKKQFDSGAETITILERELNGYSDVKNKADVFGSSRGGITITRKINREDIVFHTDLVAGVSEEWEFYGEYKEFIVKSGPQTLLKKDIDF